ncbi:cytochrome b561 and DOMON domain-containing protein At3g59070-like [Pistacia vera]|uniref:cytochrome b561 and DOMON domain-containing protein At3g59070-like n=1 Tax=Pistacia vera TaxID=55513 RepID=UPI001262F01D|nr:cytochrome b561 and DOMON domain-containing protein At3g59070-like [Pistacia vera]
MTTYFLILALLFASSISSSSAQSQTCNTYSFSNNHNSYRACNDLQALNSYLHWNYHQDTNTLDLAFRRSGTDPTRWVAWAINPTGKGMVGSQALVAYTNPNGILRAYTSPITSYSTQLQEGSLSGLEVPKISAEFADNEMIIYATIVLPKNMTTVNHVWQEGPIDGDSLGMHPVSGENVISMGSVDLLSGKVVATKGGGSSSLVFKKIHGAVNMVSWGILMPIGVMTARYMKVFKDPAWFYAHIICQCLAYTIGLGGAATGIYLGNKSHGIQFNAHRYIGILLFILGFLQVLALKLRPNKDHKYRLYWNIYHHSVGYAIIILSIVNIFQGISILESKIWKWTYIGILTFLGSIAAVLEAITWCIIIRTKKETAPVLA